MSPSLNGLARGAELCGIVQNLQNHMDLLPLLNRQYHILKCILIVVNITQVSCQKITDAQFFSQSLNIVSILKKIATFSFG